MIVITLQPVKRYTTCMLPLDECLINRVESCLDWESGWEIWVEWTWIEGESERKWKRYTQRDFRRERAFWERKDEVIKSR